ncbi:MAG: DNA polymerase III subunit alpha [Pseudomonadota bacterium]
MDAFVHLEVQSAFSFLWGAFTPEDLVRETAALGQSAVALTDYGLHGAVRFYKAALEAGIQPIVGARVPIWDGSLVTLLVRDFTAYGNLCRLVSRALGDSMAPRALVGKQDLGRWSKGLICLFGGWGSRLRTLTEQGRRDAGEFCLLELRDVLHDPDMLFVALQNCRGRNSALNGTGREEIHILRDIAETASKLNIPTVAVNGVAFLTHDEYVIHRALVDIQRRHHHRDIHALPGDGFFLASGREMAVRVPFPEALAATERIAELCRGFSMPVGALHPPSIRDPRTASRSLAVLSMKEITKRYQPVPAVYLRRLDVELGIIDRFQLADFFLLVRRVVDFARIKGIRHSVRGSSAGSLVVYLLLGGVDPVEHNLLFERFINDGRGDLPDVDLDFDSERRDEVIAYLMGMFPHSTAMVATIHRFRVRGAVRLAARSLGYSLRDIKRFSTCLPWSLRGHNLMDALENLPELKDAPIQKEDRLIKAALRLVGLPFQCSVHLGGVLIAAGEIADWTPVGLSPKGLPVAQLDKDDAEALGLLKLDLLGLRMHTAIRRSLEVLARTGTDPDLDRVPLDDRKTYALLRSTESIGVFQLESPGQRNLLGRLQPTRFSDLTAEISLFRPGPVEGNMVETYVKRRNDMEPVVIPHPRLIPILRHTYGVILFQEQVLRIVHTFAGLSYGEADAFRRAMTKDRKSKKMLLLKEKFFQGAKAKGHSKELTADIFAQVAAFASYGFCEAHAASFAHITYQSAYLKAHHPQAFYLGLLNAGQVGSYPPSLFLNEARRRGIPVYPPHVNTGGIDYEAEGAGIRVPLGVINGIGPATVRRITAERKRRGAFRDMADLQARISLPGKVMEFLYAAGALDGIPDGTWELVREVCNV